MAQTSYTVVDEFELGRGIDARSGENQISSGYCEDALNVDTVENRVRKRVGYQQFSGFIPVRVLRTFPFTSSGGSELLCFQFDSSVSLTAVRSSPLVVYGKSSNADGDFGVATTTQYYDSFTSNTRKAVSPSAPTVTVSAVEHGFSGNKFFVEAVESTSFLTLSHQFNGTVPILDSLSIDKTSFDVTATAAVSETKELLFYFYDLNTNSSTTFVPSGTETLAGSSTGTFTIKATAAGSDFGGTAHNLSNFNLIVKVWEDTGTSYSQIIPEEVRINSSGDVSFTLINPSPTPLTFFPMLLAAPPANVSAGQIAPSSTLTIQIPNVTSPFVFTGIWQTDGTEEILVGPDSVIYDDTDQTLEVSFTSGLSSVANFQVYYAFGESFTSQICVVPNVAAFTDEEPQLSVYGLDHAEIYASDEGRPGWATHIDVYRRASEERVIAGLGGNLFRAVTNDEMGMTVPSDILPNIRNRSDGDQILAPAFQETGENPQRTRGYLTFTGGSSNSASVVSATYNSTTELVEYVLSLPARAIFDSTGTEQGILTTQIQAGDQLTVTDMGYSRLNGTFDIVSVEIGDGELTEFATQTISGSVTTTDDVEITGTVTVSGTWTIAGDDSILIAVENSQVSNSFYNEVDAGGYAGVFTDRISVVGDSPLFIPGDEITTGATDAVSVYAVSSSSQLYLDGITDQVTFSNGSTITGTRTAPVISSQNSIDHYVRGDMLTHPDYERLFKITALFPSSDTSVTISGDGETATVTLSSTEKLRGGQNVLLLNAGVYTGVHTITDITTETDFTFDSTETETGVSGTLAGNLVEIDESMAHSDLLSGLGTFTLTRRWEPIEVPEDSSPLSELEDVTVTGVLTVGSVLVISGTVTVTGTLVVGGFSLTKKTYFQHLDDSAYDNQPYLKSTTVVDTMYFTNGTDEVLKFDGTNIYRAGLPRWQAGLFVGVDTTATAKIGVPKKASTSASAIDTARHRLTVALGEETKFTVGERIRLTDGVDVQVTTVTGISENGTNGFLDVQDTIASAIGTPVTCNKVTRYRYYFRLNAIDANNRMVASAVVGNDDYVVEVFEDAAVELRLLAFPPWHIYDYSRLELQAYRTHADGEVFFRLSTQELFFDNVRGYIRLVDTFSDSLLFEADPVNVPLKGAELGTTWDEPMRAKYVTSANNRLILGNLTDYPQIDLQLFPAENITSTALDGTRWLFRRNNTDAATTSDTVNRVAFEMVTTSAAASITAGPAEFTVTSTAHGQSVGNWVYLFHSDPTSDQEHIFTGWFQVSVVTDADNFVVRLLSVESTSSTTLAPDRVAFATQDGDVPVFLGTDGNYSGFRGNLFAASNFSKRLSDAINSTQVMTDRDISGQADFLPWIMAYGDAAFASGQLIVRQPRSEAVTPELVLPDDMSFNVYVNGLKQNPGAEVVFTSLRYNSRLLVSYPNFPEIMDNPRAVLEQNSDSVIDVNSADGQEITGIIPFFGESTSSDSQKQGIVVVFKTSSIYVVDVNQRVFNKIDSRGLGCTAPHSIAQVPNGIVFANESGVYRLNRSFEVIYIGRSMERKWRDLVNLDQLELAQGHSYAFGQQYKLSVPLGSATTNSEVYVYDHTSEAAGESGSWTRYDNHPATGWANLRSNAFFSSTSGKVFSVRQAGDVSDYRDDSSAINMEFTTRALHFGAPGRRKIIRGIVTNFRVLQQSENSRLSVAMDLRSEFDDTSSFIIQADTSLDNLSDSTNQKVISIRHSIPKQRGQYIQLKYTNNGLDENIDISGISFTVAGLSMKGIKEASETD